MKYILTGFLLTHSFFANALNKTIYQATYHLLEKGNVVRSASVIVQEGREGIIDSGTATDKDSFAVTVKPFSPKLVSVDYRFRTIKNGKVLEIAKTAADIIPGSDETNDFRDSAGHDFELKVTITKK